MKMAWLVFATLLVVISKQQVLVHGKHPIVPCYFIFGDSLADNGNNNPLGTMAKVNYQPYGVDFPGHVASGRFTNGKTYVDFIAKEIGFDDFILPFATARGSDILRGVNYASGGSGIYNETGANQGAHISLDQQLANHNATMRAISRLLPSEKISEHLNSCLYTVGIGNNDYINNYFLPGSPWPSKRDPHDYAFYLAATLDRQLRDLHGAGARKVAIFSLGQAGCTPFIISKTGGKGCSKVMNDAIEEFNSNLRQLVDELNRNLRDSKFIFINTTNIDPQQFINKGITELSSPCCPISNTTGLCIANSKPCEDRKKHAFWDGFHPTEAMNQITAATAWDAKNLDAAYPANIKNIIKS